MMAAEEVAPAQIQEILGTELEVDQEYYVEKQFRIARSNGEQTWHTQEKYSAIYYGPFEHNQGGFIAKQIYKGRAIVNKMYYHPLTYSTDPNTTEENRTRFYKKTDTQKNQERREMRQALTQTYEKHLPIHQYVDKDGQSQFAKDRDGNSYLGGGGRRKRTLRRAPRSRKRRSAARSKKRRARANKRKKTRRTKRP